MVHVAIAGGTGGVGRTIRDALRHHPEHKVFVLTRKVPSAESTNGEQILQVDYTDVTALQKVLEEHKIHTIISTFHISGPSLSVSQLNLIKAADQASCTKRFAPSAFAIPYPRDYVDVLPPLKYYFEAIDTLKASSLEYTVFLNGVFLDYFGMPHIETYLAPNVFAIDMENKVAAIPGDGNTPVTFTWTADLAKFIIAALDSPKWAEESRIIGDQLTFNEFVSIAEEVCGVEFEKTHDSVEMLKAGKITELPGHKELYSAFPKPIFQKFMAIFEYWTTDGTSTLGGQKSLNMEFPGIKTLTVREMLEKYWSRR